MLQRFRIHALKTVVAAAPKYAKSEACKSRSGFMLGSWRVTYLRPEIVPQPGEVEGKLQPGFLYLASDRPYGSEVFTGGMQKEESLNSFNKTIHNISKSGCGTIKPQ